jgi:pSer/pThr/pTyr-binding forkhead associated (FHA) protein
MQEGTAGNETGAASRDDVVAPFYLETADGIRIPLTEGESVAGRSDVDIKLNDGYVSRKHASFSVTDGVVSITDLGSANGSFIGDEQLPAGERRDLAPGTVFRLGQTELTLVAAEQPAELAEETMVIDAEDAPRNAAEQLDDNSGTAVDDSSVDISPLAPANVGIEPAGSPWSLKRVGENEVFCLPYGETQLGRKAEKCDVVVLGDGFISGLHCRLVAGMDNLDVTDLGSSNGTHVNHERVAPDQSMPLKAGDMLRIGQTDLEVVYEAPELASNEESDEVADET